MKLQFFSLSPLHFVKIKLCKCLLTLCYLWITSYTIDINIFAYLVLLQFCIF